MYNLFINNLAMLDCHNSYKYLTKSMLYTCTDTVGIILYSLIILLTSFLIFINILYVL